MGNRSGVFRGGRIHTDDDLSCGRWSTLGGTPSRLSCARSRRGIGLLTMPWDAQLRRFRVAFVGLAILSALVSTPAHAAEARSTVLDLSVATRISLGTHPVATIRLTAHGRPVPGQAVDLRLDGRVSLRVATDIDGEG